MSSQTRAEDRTRQARIRDAAIAQFGVYGVAETSLKMIAEDAGVSPALIVHHFGSKEGLRRACDEYVAATFRASKLDALAQGPQLDPLAAFKQVNDGGALLRYLARTLGDGSPEVAELIDEMVDDAVEYLAEGERSGLIEPSEHPRGRAVVLLLWSLGLLTLHEHLERLIGVDLLGDPTEFGPYALPAMEIMTRGVMHEDVYRRTRETFSGEQEIGDD